MAKLAAVYANSVYELALEQGQVDALLPQAEFMKTVLLDADCSRVLMHPHISDEEKLEFFGKLFEGKVHEFLIGLMHVAIRKNREIFLIPALASLIDLINRYLKQTSAEVYVAAPLEELQLEKLRRFLSSKLGKTVEVNMNIDESLIGGPFIKVDGYYIDQSVKTRLRNMAARMKEGGSV